MKRNLPTVTFVFDDDLEKAFVPDIRGRLSNVIFTPAHQLSFVPLDKAVLYEALNVFTWRKYPREKITTRTLVDVIVQQSEEKFAAACEQADPMSQKIAHTILGEPHRVVFLLNTPGGYVATGHKFTNYIDHVQSLAGEVWAYGNGYVNSTAADLLMNVPAQCRHLHKDAELLFHLSTGARVDDAHTLSTEKMAESRASELASMKEMFGRATYHPDHAKYVVDLVDRASQKSVIGDDVEIVFTAAEAQVFWHVGCHSTPDLLWHYLRNLRPKASRSTLEKFLSHANAEPITKFFGL